MAEFPAFPLWTDAYLGDTHHLDTLEHGTYLLLLICMWRTGECRLPSDDATLIKYAGLDPRQWRRIKSTIMRFFTVVEDGYITQLRLQDEWDFCKKRSKRQSAKSKARWLKNKKSGDAAAMPREYQVDAPTPTPTPTPIRKKVPVADATRPAETEKDIPVNEPPKARLFREGKTVLVSMGVSEKQSGAVIGRWLKTNPDADGVLAALHYAADNNVIEPIGYVTKLLNTGGINGRRYETLTASERAYRLADEARELERQAGIVGQVDIVRGH